MTLPVFPILPGLTFTVLKTPNFNTLDMRAPNSYEVRIQQELNPTWDFTLLYEFLHDFPWGEYVSVSELRTLMGFFNWQGGKAGSFLFTDPDDNYVGPALSTAIWLPNHYFNLNQGILDAANHWQQVTVPGVSGGTIPTFNDSGGTTTDGGVTWQDMGVYSSSGFPNAPLAELSIVTDGAGNFYSPIQRTLDGNFYEDITDLNGAIAVYANGVLQTLGTDYTIGGPGLAVPGASYMGMYLQWAVGGSPGSWEASHSYSLTDVILDSAGHIQEVTTAGTSGTSTPLFNEVGGTTQDPAFIIWQDEGTPAWAATTAYVLGDGIIDGAGHIQQVTTAGTSGGTIPTFNNSGGTTTDGTVTWQDQGMPAWAASTQYYAGNLILDGSSHIQEATTSAISGASTPSFNDSGGSVDDPTGSVIWTDQGAVGGPTGPITVAFNFYFRVRFESDSQDFEKFLNAGTAAVNYAGQGGGIWTIGGDESSQGNGTLKLTTARPTPL